MTYIPKINNNRLANDAVTSDKILDGEVMTDDLALDAVTGDQLADDAVGAEHIAAGAVGEDELAEGSVTNGKLGADAVDGSKLADDAVGSEHIATGAVGTDELAADAVTGDKLADDAVGSEHIATGAVGTDELADDSVTADKMAAGLDAIATANAAIGDITASNQKITNLALPEDEADAATKGYVDQVAMGLDVKASVRVATQEGVDLLDAPAAIDGVMLSAGERVLVKAQEDATENGIYVFDGEGNALTRAEDADTDAEVSAGMFTFVEEGTNADQGWVLTSDNPVQLGISELVFSQFSNAVIVSTLDSLTDVDTGAALNGSALVFDGEGWVAKPNIRIGAVDPNYISFASGASLGSGEEDPYLSLQADSQIELSTFGKLILGATLGVDLNGGVSFNQTVFDPSNGGEGEPTTTYTINNMADGDSHYVLLVDSSQYATTVMLPQDAEQGRVLQIKDAGGSASANNITIDANGSTIDGGSDYMVDTDYQSVTLVASWGGVWYVI